MCLGPVSEGHLPFRFSKLALRMEHLFLSILQLFQRVPWYPDLFISSLSYDFLCSEVCIQLR